jgi:hypothetical protein
MAQHNGRSEAYVEREKKRGGDIEEAVGRNIRRRGMSRDP